MISVENEVFDNVYQSVASVVPEGCFKSQYVPNPTKFPFATLWEIDNYVDPRMTSSSDSEEFAVVTFEANVYAMSRSECREVMDAIDQSMTALNFTRLSLGSVMNLADSMVFRMTARYRAAAGHDKVLYRHS